MKKPDPRAFIDIGTNSIRYLAARLEPGSQAEIIARGLETPRLGAGSAHGLLQAGSISRALAALEKIAAKLRALGVTRFRAVGTEALRRAPNRDSFLREAAGLGLQIEIISGAAEAALVRAGVMAGGDLPPGTLLVDIGGGSTEFIREEETISLPLGCVAILENYGLAAEGAREHIRASLQELPQTFTAGGGNMAGLGGTFTTLAAVKLGLEPYRGEAVHGLILEQAWIESFFRQVCALPLKQRADIPGLPRDRADIISAGAAIALEVMKRGNFAQVTISDHGILFGLLAQAQA